MFELAVLVISSALNLLLGLGVYIKNSRSVTNGLFFMMTSSFALWSIVNYFSLHPVLFPQLVWVRLVLFSAAFLCLSVFLTFQNFPQYAENRARRARSAALISTAIVMILTLTPLVFKDLKVVNGSAQPVPNVGIALFVLLVFGLLGGGVYTLIKKFRTAEGQQRIQIKLVLTGLAATFSLIVLTNLLLVVIFKYTKLVQLGPAYSLIFSGTLAYAIARHQLFDVRAALARSIGYVLLLGWIAAVYTAGLLGVIDVIFSGPKHEAERQYLSIILILPLVLSFPYIRRFFDRTTSRIFYRDSYDSQMVLDKLGNVLVAEIDLHKILTGSRRVLSEAVKCSFMEFVLLEKGRPLVDASNGASTPDDLAALLSHLKSARDDVVVRDELSPQREIYSLLNRNNIAISLRLRTQQQKVGYILFGDRQTGISYGTQDKTLLAIAGNELAVAIQNALRFEEIQKFNITLQQKVDEATKELRKANSRLKELDKTKDEFISMASHQLRTPLTTVKGYLSMILEGDMGAVKKEQREMIQHSFDGANRMVYLIADLLNVSRLQTGKFVIDNKPTDLASVVETEIGQLKEQAKTRQIELLYQKPEHFPVLNIDETKIRQVIMNFLDNALYYTPKGGKVEAGLSATVDTVSYTVTDNGLGVPKEVQHHLFSKFYRAENARKMRPDGTGLGLFMAKKVVVAEGGSIIFKSTEGKGSTFGFSFPRKQMEPKGTVPSKRTVKVKTQA